MNIIRDIIFLTRLARKHYLATTSFEAMLFLCSFPSPKHDMRIADWFFSNPDMFLIVTINYLYFNLVFLCLFFAARAAARRRGLQRDKV